MGCRIGHLAATPCDRYKYSSRQCMSGYLNSRSLVWRASYLYSEPTSWIIFAVKQHTYSLFQLSASGLPLGHVPRTPLVRLRGFKPRDFQTLGFLTLGFRIGMCSKLKQLRLYVGDLGLCDGMLGFQSRPTQEVPLLIKHIWRLNGIP